MTRGGLPAEVLALCKEHVDSFEKLEILGTLGRHPAKEQPRLYLTEKLQLPPHLLKQNLQELQRSGLVVVTADDLVRLDNLDATPALAELLRLYEDDRLAVMRALSTIAMERIRGMAARAFSNAFVMRKQRKDDDDG